MNKNYLFLIGINKYKHASDLKSCVKDCRDVRKLLIEKFAFEIDEVFELYDSKATKSAVIEQFGELKEYINVSDSLIIYYSGHGEYHDSNNMGYWVPYEGYNDIDRVAHGSCISNREILELIKEIRARHIFVVSDSCFSQSILICDDNDKSLKSGIHNGFFEGDDISYSELIDKDNYDYDDIPSRWALSAGSKEVVQGKNSRENSLFTKAFLYVLKTCGDKIRVGTIIEEVKKYFDGIDGQKPQGYPLKDPNHKGGEFIFKTEMINSKGIFSDVELLFRHYRNDMKFQLIYEATELSDIQYRLYAVHDEVFGVNSFFFVFGEGAKIEKTYKDYKEKCESVCDNNQMIILLPNKKSLIQPEKRVMHVLKMFKPKSVYYIQDFMREHCFAWGSSEEEELKFLTERYFVAPTYIVRAGKDRISKKNDIDFIEQWIQRRYMPILVITGVGGIGKTTFADYITDMFIGINKESYVVYISAKSILDKLGRMVDVESSFDIYDFFSCYKTDFADESFMNNDMFGLNVDASNIFVVVDGLDEVISRFKSFDVAAFLASITKINKSFGYGKVIITCRTRFWDKSGFSRFEKKDKATIIEMCPFDSEQSLEYFKLCFKDDKSKVDKGEKIINDFSFPEDDLEENMYHPFVLDVIRSMIVKGYGDIESSESVFSEYLCYAMKKDYIIYRILEREIVRLNQIEVDDQVRLFMYFIIKSGGTVDEKDMKKVVDAAVNRYVDELKVEAIKSHPFFNEVNGRIFFRYDFLGDYFKGLYITDYFKYNSKHDKVDDEFISIVSGKAWSYKEAMCDDVASRFVEWDDDNLLKWSSLVGELWQLYEDNKIDESILKRCVSGVFTIALKISIRLRSLNTEHNTQIMRSLFGMGDNRIKGMVILGLNDPEKHIRFDFRNCVIKRSYIDDYSSLNECVYENTILSHTDIRNINLRNRSKKIPFNQIKRLECTVDDKFNRMLEEHNEENKHKKQKTILFIEKYFNLFMTGGRLQMQVIDHTALGRGGFSSLKIKYSNIGNKILSFKKVMDIMIKNDVIIRVTHYNEEKAKISDEYKMSIAKFLRDREIDEQIKHIIDLLMTSDA